jgi:hypothetical protein
MFAIRALTAAGAPRRPEADAWEAGRAERESASTPAVLRREMRGATSAAAITRDTLNDSVF